MKPKHFLKENHISYLEINRVSHHAFQGGYDIPARGNITAFRKKSINIIGSVREDE